MIPLAAFTLLACFGSKGASVAQAQSPRRVIFEPGDEDASNVILAFKARVAATTRYQLLDAVEEKPELFVGVYCLGVTGQRDTYICHYDVHYFAEDDSRFGGLMRLFSLDLSGGMASGRSAEIAEHFFQSFVLRTTDSKLKSERDDLAKSLEMVWKLAQMEELKALQATAPNP